VGCRGGKGSGTLYSGRIRADPQAGERPIGSVAVRRGRVYGYVRVGIGEGESALAGWVVVPGEWDPPD